MRNFEKYFDFIKDEDTRNVVKKIADKAYFVYKNFIPAVTEFVNPYAAELSIPIINDYDINYKLFPSYEHGERKVFILYPEFQKDLNIDDYITGLRIFNRSKFKTLGHKDYLGSIMSLGFDRNKTGDIFVYDNYADIVIHNDISDYVIYNLEQIGKNKIEIQKLGIDDISYKEQEHILLNITSSSLRLDNVVKHLINKSREISATYIKSGNVKVNWQVEDSVSFLVKEGDMISISKYGRYKIAKCIGVTKSGKNKIEIKHYV